MPKMSKQSAAHVNDHGIVEDRYEDVEGYRIQFIEFREAADGTPLLKGLPGDRCNCPHWGYVQKGRITYRFDDHDEVFEAGDAFYLPPGHIRIAEAGTELLQFSPSLELEAVSAAMLANMRAMQSA
jgi:mannose-6-phosphate isomerase-like protein (cupin superfamily)